MAGTTTIAAKLTLDGSQPVQSVRSFKQQLREAQVDLLQMQQAFGDLSPEAITAARNVAMLRDRVQEAREVADLFDPGKKFQAFAGALSTVAAGYGAVQGAMGLFGAESKELEKQLLKVQSAMALAQGLSAIADGAKDFQRLGVIAKDALAGIRTGLLATGIGAFVVALGLLVAYWDDIKKAVSGVSAEQKKLLADATKLNDTEKEKLTHLDDQDNILKQQGKSEKQILELKEAQIKTVIAAGEAQLEAQKQIDAAAIRTAERNKEILTSILEFVTQPLQAITTVIDAIGEKFGKNFGTNAALNKGLSSAASLIFDPKGMKEEAEKSYKEQEEGLTKLRNQYAGYQNQITEINKQAAARDAAFRKELKAIRDAAADDTILDAEILAQKQLKQAYEQQQADIKQSQYSRVQKNQLLQAVDDKYHADTIKALDVRIREISDKLVQAGIDDENAKKERAKKGLSDLLNGGLENLNALQGVNNGVDTTRLDAIGQQQAAEMEQLNSFYAEKFALAKGNAAAEESLTEAYERSKTEIARNANNARLDILSNALGSISNLIGQQTVAGKVLAVAQATIDTYVGANKALAQGGIFGFIGAAAVIAAGLANVKKIISTKIAGATSSGVSAPTDTGSVAAPIIPSAQVSNTALPQDQINQMGNAAIRAYVVESDNTNSQEKITRINRQARLGG